MRDKRRSLRDSNKSEFIKTKALFGYLLFRKFRVVNYRIRKKYSRLVIAIQDFLVNWNSATKCVNSSSANSNISEVAFC